MVKLGWTTQDIIDDLSKDYGDIYPKGIYNLQMDDSL